ncbi:MAG: hypothetical protein D4R90_03735 [Nitrosopumilales archaeon]|nr:MAG: hypothetical protein D4R90_03735 [Nitrosopumilales archaeon]
MDKKILVLTLSLILLGVNVVYAENGDIKEFENHDHTKYFKAKKETATFDANYDGLNDFYAKGYFNNTDNKVFHIDYKIQDCLPHGSTFANAKMKVGFSNPDAPYAWYSNGFKAWNSWFKSVHNPDPDKQIELVVINDGAGNFPSAGFPSSGDNIFQKSINMNTGSFTYYSKIKELGGQSGWEGSISFTAPLGSYLFWTIFPATGYGESCDHIAGLGIPVNVNAKHSSKDSD